MMKTLPLAVAITLALLGPAAAAEQCELQQAASLDTSTEPDGSVSVPVSVNGSPLYLLVDTGSVSSSISEDIADQLQLRRSPALRAQQMAGGIPFTQLAQADLFKIGNLSTSRFQFYVAPRGVLGNNFGGLLGPDIMSNYDIEIDYANSKVNIFSQEHCPGRVVYWTHQIYAEVPMTVDENWHISVPAKLDNGMVRAVVDTGAAHSFMTLATAERVFGISQNDPKLEKRDPLSLNGAKRTRTFFYPFQALTIEGVAVQNPNIIIVEDSGLREGMPDLVLGVTVLRQLHLYIAYKEQKLYATAAEAR
jgi:predicted aspartyl protease